MKFIQDLEWRNHREVLLIKTFQKHTNKKDCN